MNIIKKQLIEECEAMLSLALKHGDKVNGKIVNTIIDFRALMEHENTKHENYEDALQNLTYAHGKLSKIISPTKPKTALLIHKHTQDKNFFHFLGPIPFVRRMLLTAVVSLTVFILISLSPDVEEETMKQGILVLDNMELFANLLFLLSAAALGAALYALYSARRYTVNDTFDPSHESSYWIQFVLGLISGLVLSELLMTAQAFQEMLGHAFGKPTLALLGGFSGRAVQTVLNRLVDTLDSLIKGNSKNIVKKQEEYYQQAAKQDDMQNRSKIALDLVNLKNDLLEKGENVPEEVNQKINNLLSKLMEDDIDEELIELSPIKVPIQKHNSTQND